MHVLIMVSKAWDGIRSPSFSKTKLMVLVVALLFLSCIGRIVMALMGLSADNLSEREQFARAEIDTFLFYCSQERKKRKDQRHTTGWGLGVFFILSFNHTHAGSFILNHDFTRLNVPWCGLRCQDGGRAPRAGSVFLNFQ